jgi:hypothetical protein
VAICRPPLGLKTATWVTDVSVPVA